MALIQTCQIQAIMTVPKRLSFSAQLSNCNLATCWHIELSILGLLHLSISMHLSNSFSCSMKSFLGLALYESCVASATMEKHWCPMSTFSYFRGKAFLGKPATIPFGENKDVSWIKFRLLYDNSFWAWPCGYHPPSKVPICSFPASKRDDNPLRTMGRPHPQCVWFKVQQPSLCVTEPPQTLFDATTSLFGEEKGEKGAAPLTLQSRCEEGKMRVLIGLRVHGIPEISTLPSGPFIVDHAIEFSKPRVRMHYTALYNVEMADNGVEPRTSTTLIMQTFPMPTPHVASLLVASYVSAQLPTGEIGLHQLHWTCCVTEPIPLHTKTNPVAQQFPVHLQLNESKVRLSCSGDFD